MAGFLIPAGTNSGTSPDEISRRRMLADMLAQQGMGEVRNPWEGLANIGISFLAGRQMRKADREERAGRKSGMDALIAALGGGGGQPSQAGGGAVSPDMISALSTPGRSQTGGIGSDIPAAASGQAGQYRGAIAGIESAGSGDYSALGPVTKTGDRAYGRYQVMGANIPSWTKQALGREMTPEEFLSDPRAQDATFDTIFGGYAQKSGPEGAARQWFTGSPTGEGSDQLGTSGDEYAQRFTAALKGSGMPQESVGTHDPMQGGNQAQIAALLGNEWIPPELQKFALDRLMPQTAQSTDDIREFQYGQENPAFMDYMKSTRGGTTVNVGPTGIDYGDPEAGLAWKRRPDGTVETDERGAPIAIPYQGGKPYVEQQEAEAKGKLRKDISARTSGIVGEEVNAALSKIEADPVWTTGIVGAALQDMPGTAAHAVKNHLNAIKANISLDKLQAMRESSPTGGALGNVTEWELELLQSTYGSVLQSQNDGQLKSNLRRLSTIYNFVVHGDPSGGGGGVPEAAAAAPTQDLETPPADIDPELWKLLTPEERQQYLAAGQ